MNIIIYSRILLFITEQLLKMFSYFIIQHLVKHGYIVKKVKRDGLILKDSCLITLKI